MLRRIRALFGRGGDGGLPPPCEEARSHSSDYLDGDLEYSLAQRIREHLGVCPACQAFFDTLSATISLLRAMPPRPAPDGFADRVRRNIRANPQLGP